MRRVVGVVSGITLALAFSSTVVLAAPSLADPFPAGRTDIGSQVMLQLFGETSDSTASFSAARGDRTSESPLRELALQVPSSGNEAAFVAGTSSPSPQPQTGDNGGGIVSLAQAADAGLVRSEVRFAPPNQDDSLVTLQPSRSLFTAAYQPIAPATAVSPDPGTQAFSPLVTGSVGLSDDLPSASHSAVYVPSTVQVGPVQFQGHVEGASTDTPQLSLRDNSYGAGANFDVRAGKRKLDLNISSSYEHVGRDDSSFSASTLDSGSSWTLPELGGPLVVPSYANLNKLSLGAGVAVPVLRGLTLNLNYDAKRLYGGYGLPGLLNLDAIDNTYGGKLTFQIPDTSSTLSISAYQDRYQDNVLPLNGSTQMREDVNFTVKF
ncbi:MAG: hypothetical protein WA814_12485 [Candidatus Baltobacteraceae bacterium]